MFKDQNSVEGGRSPSSGSVPEPEKLIRSSTFQVVPVAGALMIAVGGWLFGVLVVTVTLSNVAVVLTVLLRLVTAKPTNTSLVILTVSVPTCAQLTPSAD